MKASERIILTKNEEREARKKLPSPCDPRTLGGIRGKWRIVIAERSAWRMSWLGGYRIMRIEFNCDGLGIWHLNKKHKKSDITFREYGEWGLARIKGIARYLVYNMYKLYVSCTRIVRIKIVS